MKRLLFEATPASNALAKRIKLETPAETPRIAALSTFLRPAAEVNFQKYLRSRVELMDHQVRGLRALLNPALLTLFHKRLLTRPVAVGGVGGVTPQVENVKRFVANARTPTLPSSLLVSDDPGLGKTLTAIACMCALRSVAAPEHEGFNVLVVAPKSVVLQWRDEIIKFSRTLEENVAVNELKANAQICILSYEFVSYKFNETYERIVEENVADWHVRMGVVPSLLFKPGHFKMVVFDEAHKIRNAKTRMHIAMLHVAPAAANHAEYPRLGLSGTPIVNRPSDMASIGAVLKFGAPFDDPKKRFYERDILHTSTSRGFEKTLFLRHLKQDVLELPRLVKHTKRLALNDKEIEQHQRWLANLISVAQLTNAKRATFVELLTALMRVRQARSSRARRK